MVVRLPEFAERVGLRDTPPAHDKTYRGIDRLPWEVEAEQYSAVEFRRFFKHIDGGFFGERNIRLTQDREDVLRFLRLAPDNRNEVLAICTNDIPGSPKIEGDDDLEYLGIELFALGEWSPHREIFLKADRYEHWITKFNANGLFDDARLCETLAEDYILESKLHRLEPLADPPVFVRLWVYRVRQLKPT